MGETASVSLYFGLFHVWVKEWNGNDVWIENKHYMCVLTSAAPLGQKVKTLHLLTNRHGGGAGSGCNVMAPPTGDYNDLHQNFPHQGYIWSSLFMNSFKKIKLTLWLRWFICCFWNRIKQIFIACVLKGPGFFSFGLNLVDLGNLGFVDAMGDTLRCPMINLRGHHRMIKRTRKEKENLLH